MKALSLSMVLAVTGLFGPVVSFAAPQCQGIFASEYALKGQVEVLPSGQKGLRAQDYADRILEIHKMLGPLAIPDQAKITVGDNFKQSSFNAGTWNVYVGLRPDSMGAKNPRANLGTLSHEYGHAIFEKNLMKDLESYKSLRNDVLTLEARLQKTVDAANQLQYKADVTFDKKAKEDLLNQAKDKRAEADVLAKQKREITSYWAVRRALHEIFADATALVATKDPQVIREVLENEEKSYKEHSSDELMLRDFTSGRNHLDQKRWLKEAPAITQLFGDIYYAFLPVRWELWKAVRSHIDSENYRKELLPKVFTILERNLSEVMAQPYDSLGPIGFKGLGPMNVQIIKDIRSEL